MTSPGHWDRQAATYDRRSAFVEQRWLATARPWVCGRARGATLEIGVGTGANLPHYPAGVALTAVDASSAMLDEARRRAGALGRAVDLRQADAAALPFADDVFDTVLCTYTLCCVPDERVALTEALRVLRPGGDLLLADHVVSTSALLRLAQRVLERFTVPRQGEHFTRRPLQVLRTLGVPIVSAERSNAGALERVHARAPR